jgi:hypothetical protein
MKQFFTCAVAIVMALPLWAGQAQVENATARKTGTTWTFEVTIRHDDTGWDHYADGWAVLTPSGEQIGYRKLHHPHENEQPFTRSLSGVTVPDGLSEVLIRAHDSVHGWSDATFTVRLK